MAQKIEIKKTSSKTISNNSKTGRLASVKSERKTDKLRLVSNSFVPGRRPMRTAIGRQADARRGI